MPFGKRVKRFLRYLLLRLLHAALAALPLRWAQSLGEKIGTLAFHLARQEREKSLESLAIAFPSLPGEKRADLAHNCFRHLGRIGLEWACIPQIDAHLEEWVKWPLEHRQVLENALARGKGVLFISGHVGNWELLARRIAWAGYPCQTIAKETTDARLTAWVQRFREKSGLKTIWRGQPQAARHMLRALKHGEILGMLIDQDTNVQSVFVPFFGKLAATPRAAADLALRTQAAVILGFCQRSENGTYSISMEELPLPAKESSEQAVLQLTEALSLGIEKAIRRHPEQWVWMHRRWKTQANTDT